MNLKLKQFLANYGLKFAGLYLISFVLLVTFFGKYSFNTFPGDVLIERASFTIYLPFVSSLAIAVFFLVIFEVYKNMR